LAGVIIGIRMVINNFSAENLPLTPTRSNKLFHLAPLTGFLLFILLYIVAASLYPGGSDADKSAVGFSWFHNYWCELLAGHAQNGEDNIARPVAIAAMFILCTSIGLFWYFASFLFPEKTAGRWITRIAGVGSMFMILLLFVAHDTAINLSGLLGIIAMVFTMIGLYKHRAYILMRLGIFCLVLCVLNNYIYHTTLYMYYLPVIQKFTFLVFLLWFGLVNIYVYRFLAAFMLRR
jgi:hypothetical protein